MAKKTTSKDSKKPLYKISFASHGTIYEIYAKQVAQSPMFGFIEAEELVFDTRSSVVVDPSEERLKIEFTDVKRTYIPLHAVLRIDEVAKRGTAKITDISSKETKNVSMFPSSIYSSQDSLKSPPE